MGLLKKEQKARVEGMKLASRLIAESNCKTVGDCIKLIDDEIIANGGKPNEFGMTSFEMQDLKRKIAERTIMSIQACAIWAARTEFDFGRNRLVRFVKKFDSLAEDIMLEKSKPKEGYDGVSLFDIVETIRYETSIDLVNKDLTIYDDNFDWRGFLKDNGYYKEINRNRKRKKKVGVDNGNQDENK